MEVLLITRPINHPWNEGSKHLAWTIARQARYHRFHVLTNRKSDLGYESLSLKSWQIYKSDELNAWEKTRLLKFLFSNNIKDLDVLHSFFIPRLSTSFVLSSVSKARNKSFLQTVPGLPRRFASQNASNLLKSDQVICLSDWTAEKLAASGIKNIARINAGINTEKFFPARNQLQDRKELGLPLDETIVLYSGELTRLGSLNLMLKLIKLVLSESYGIHFIFACPTRLPSDVINRQKAIEAVAQMGYADRIHFLGDVDDFPSLLRASDIFVYPVTHMAGKIDTPFTLLEAMSTELPIVMSDIQPLPEVVKGSAGVCIPPENIRSFAAAIIDLSDNARERKKMGQNGRRLVMKYFHIDQMVKDYEGIYERFG